MTALPLTVPGRGVDLSVVGEGGTIGDGDLSGHVDGSVVGDRDACNDGHVSVDVQDRSGGNLEGSAGDGEGHTLCDGEGSDDLGCSVDSDAGVAVHGGVHLSVDGDGSDGECEVTGDVGECGFVGSRLSCGGSDGDGQFSDGSVDGDGSVLGDGDLVVVIAQVGESDGFGELDRCSGSDGASGVDDTVDFLVCQSCCDARVIFYCRGALACKIEGDGPSGLNGLVRVSKDNLGGVKAVGCERHISNCNRIFVSSLRPYDNLHRFVCLGVCDSGVVDNDFHFCSTSTSGVSIIDADGVHSASGLAHTDHSVCGRIGFGTKVAVLDGHFTGFDLNCSACGVDCGVGDSGTIPLFIVECGQVQT